MEVTKLQASLYEIAELMLALPLAFLLLWLLKNRRNLEDIVTRYMRKGKCVKIRFRTVANNVLYKYRVPDQHGMIKIDNGFYHYQRECAVYDPYVKMFEISFLENQMEPISGDMILTDNKIKIKVKKDGRTIEEERTVPTVVVDYAQLRPKMVKLPNVYNEKGEMIEEEQSYTSQALKEFADDHVASDIVTSTSKKMKQLEYCLMASLAACGLLIIIGYLLYDQIKKLDLQMQLMNAALLQGRNLASAAVAASGK